MEGAGAFEMVGEGAPGQPYAAARAAQTLAVEPEADGVGAIELDGHALRLQTSKLQEQKEPLEHLAQALEDTEPIFSTKSPLSTVTTCDTLTTLRFRRLASPCSSETLPGSRARVRFEVKAQTTVVAIRLALKTSF